MSQARKGKIARAPVDVRKSVNEMLRNNVPYARIIKFLESKDIFGVDDQNITNWRGKPAESSGYNDWLKQEERLEDMSAKREFAMEIVKQNQGSQLHEATLHLAASQLYDAITDFDVTRLKDLLDESPENYAAIVNSLAKLSKGALDLRKYQDAVRDAQKEIQKLRDPKSDLTDEDRKAIVNKVDEILGLK